MKSTTEIKADNAKARLALKQARAKGLTVTRNQFVDGWTITLPGGTTYLSPSTADMIDYVQRY